MATGRTYVTFRGRANNDITVMLTTLDSSTSYEYYIIIGGWGNSKSAILDRGSYCMFYSAVILSGTYFEEFWISWSGNYIKVGTGSSPGTSTFMSCYQSSVYTLNFIWIFTGWGSSGEWRIPNGNTLLLD